MRIFILFLLVASTFVSGEGGLLPMFSFVGIIFGGLALVYTYHMTQTKNGLEMEILKRKKIIAKQKKEIQHNEKIIKQQIFELEIEKEDEEAAEEIKNELKEKHSGHSETLRREFWEKIERMDDSNKGSEKKGKD